MATYFIDYENTHSLNGINELTKEDSVIIFYSDNANSLSFDIHQEILKCEAYIEYKLVKVGTPNALDFQLSTYLGYLIKEKEISSEPIFIISKDKGFSAVSHFWEKEKSIIITLQKSLSNREPLPDDISPTTTKVEKQNKTKKEDKPQTIDRALKNCPQQFSAAEIKEIKYIATQYKTTKALNDNINKILKDSAKTGAAIKAIKPFLKK